MKFEDLELGALYEINIPSKDNVFALVKYIDNKLVILASSYYTEAPSPGLYWPCTSNNDSILKYIKKL